MALQGTIKDFALPDIFQLIGIQRKTGLLTLENGDDVVTIKFLEGQVVGADTRTETLEDRLGGVLVRTGRITSAQLHEALRTQKNTCQRLGYILVSSGHITEDDLVDALRVQSSQIIYRMFRWHDGNYNFDSVEDLEYDQKHFQPISSETILMEGARMVDEWPIIERRIKSDKMILRKTASAEGLDLAGGSLLEDDIEFDIGLFDDPESEPEPESVEGPEIKVSEEEKGVLSLVDGHRSVREICDLVNIGEFDTFRLLSEMFTRCLVEEVPRDATVLEVSSQSRLGRVVALVSYAVVGLMVVVSLGTMKSNPFTPWRLVADSVTTDRLKYYSSQARLEKIEQALDVFFFDAGTVPRSLALLSQGGYLRPEDLLDPWGRVYAFQVSPGGYQLRGLDEAGQPAPELTTARRFTGMQRRMLGDGEKTPE